ncbi:transglycosylase SLT domain-containing protein [Streptomyces sp. A7024]|uniref:Transglycosylase SLT domain-containing protein n=1 Tax=Streptomyces coryli TaxID=1128680 RepID=A0A6G4U096_9ACTN|nr:transglycosylase SLT domain-containing protein [Streptomyces coryli]NGN65655.1 transglycosylase SLT domain-containing protein [Streptomyces coryli]
MPNTATTARTTFRKRLIAAAGVSTAAVAVSLAVVPAANAAPAAQPNAVKYATPASADTVPEWINEALKVMDKHDIPGTYNGLHKNIMRESGGDPNAMNGWDINAQNGTPSKGLLQVIQPTFDAYHVEGTSTSLTDPVANIVAAANYAADKYGSIDNVNSAY